MTASFGAVGSFFNALLLQQYPSQFLLQLGGSWPSRFFVHLLVLVIVRLPVLPFPH